MAEIGQKPSHGLSLILICLASAGIKSKFHM
jgi:hypothetical protein